MVIPENLSFSEENLSYQSVGCTCAVGLCLCSLDELCTLNPVGKKILLLLILYNIAPILKDKALSAVEKIL